jgi:hypothetical protein
MEDGAGSCVIDFTEHCTGLGTNGGEGAINIILDGQPGLIKFTSELQSIAIDCRLLHTATIVKGSEECSGGMIFGLFVKPFWVKCWGARTDRNTGFSVETFSKHLLAAHTQHRRRTPQPSPKLDDFLIIDEEQKTGQVEIPSPWKICQVNHDYSV